MDELEQAEVTYMVMRERVYENERGRVVVHRSYIGKSRRLVDERHAKRYETVDRAETALADYVMRQPRFLGELIVVVKA